MDLEAAIHEHVTWRTRFWLALNGLASLEPAPGRLADAHHCALGHWLDAEALRYPANYELQAAIASHAAFHHAAERVVLLLDAGNPRAAQQLLHSEELVDKLSCDLLRHLEALRTPAAIA